MFRSAPTSAALPKKSLLGIVVAVLVVFSIVSVTQRGSLSRQRAASQRQLASLTPKPSTDYGYVSSNQCIACHPSEYDSWHRSYHRTMTQPANAATVLGDFNGIKLPYGDQVFELERNHDEFFIKAGNAKARVVQTTGSHHYQVYWTNRGGLLQNFPFIFRLDEQRWVRRDDVFLLPPKGPKGLEEVRIWNDSCISCHATHGQPKLEPDRRGARTMVAELGISCEACHGPAKEHVERYANPLTRYANHLTGKGDPMVTNPMNVASKKSSQVCGQCHGITRSLDRQNWNNCGFIFRPGDELEDSRIVARHPQKATLPYQSRVPSTFFENYFWRDGMVRVSGREFNGLLETPCYQRGELSCLSCHAMHDSDPNDQLRRDIYGNQACLQCHTEMADDIQQHTHHATASQGSLCYNCHMPHTTYGLVKAIRSHQIDSPSTPTSLYTGRPHACNLCHLDKTLEWTSQHMNKWFGEVPPGLGEQEKSVSAALLWLLKGDAGQRAIVAWHLGWQPAIAASGDDWQAPFLAELLNDPYAVVRSIAGQSLIKLRGFEAFDFDYVAPEAVRRQKVEEVKTMWGAMPVASPLRSHCLLDEEGRIMQSELIEIIRQRDDRPVDLFE